MSGDLVQILEGVHGHVGDPDSAAPFKRHGIGDADSDGRAIPRKGIGDVPLEPGEMLNFNVNLNPAAAGLVLDEAGNYVAAGNANMNLPAGMASYKDASGNTVVVPVPGAGPSTTTIVLILGGALALWFLLARGTPGKTNYHGKATDKQRPGRPATKGRAMGGLAGCTCDCPRK